MNSKIYNYDNAAIAAFIKQIAKQKNIKLSDMLRDLNLNINTVSEFGKGKNINVISLFLICDYLDINVDLLRHIGRLNL